MSKPRIIAGSAKGRSLETPKRGTRPSPSRLREALFNILEFYERGSFLDLYSGSGAIGLEAASRGWQASCVELSRAAAQVIRNNARALKLEVTIVQADALKFVKTHPNSFDIVFAAPPYPVNLLEVFQAILEASPAHQRGLYIFQHPDRLELALEVQCKSIEVTTRHYGSNALSFIEAKQFS